MSGHAIPFSLENLLEFREAAIFITFITTIAKIYALFLLISWYSNGFILLFIAAGNNVCNKEKDIRIFIKSDGAEVPTL